MINNLGPVDWNVLWNGAIGSLVAGLVAAIIALYVVKRSTYNASCDAIKQMHDADRLSRLERSQAQEALERQLQEQRRLAALDRQIAARAKLIDLLSEFSIAVERREDRDFAQMDRSIAMALANWRINLDPFDDKDLRSELSAWGGLFHEIQDVLGMEDPEREGPAIMNLALTHLQKAALHHGDPYPEGHWTSKKIAEGLEETRLAGEAFCSGRKSTFRYLFRPRLS